jgi:hypothetical protein
MDPPQGNAGDDPKAVYLGSFGPTYVTIPIEGDGMDGNEPLPPPEVKTRGNSKATKTLANERTRKSSKEASHKRQKTKGEKRGKKKEKKQKGRKISHGESDGDDEEEEDHFIESSSSDEGTT